MVPYRLNMARGHVLPLETRKRWRRWLAAYFLAVLAVLAICVGRLTHDRIMLWRQEERVDAMERQFLNQRPGAASVRDEMRRLSREMAVCEEQLGVINGFRKAESHAGAILLGLVNVMPAGMDLGQVSIDGGAAKLGVEVHVPAGRAADEGMTPPRLIALWSAEPLLMGKVSRFTSEKSERVQVGVQDVMSWRFTGVLGGGQ